MTLPTDQRRYRRLKTVLTVIAAILAMPFIIVAMFGAAGERR